MSILVHNKNIAGLFEHIEHTISIVVEVMDLQASTQEVETTEYVELPELQIVYYSSIDGTQPEQADAVSGTTINPV